MSWWRGLDVVVGYQVSWILMFADYSRYTRSVRGSAVAVFLGLAVTSAWMMPLGAIAARAAGSSDPGAMMDAVGLGAAGRQAAAAVLAPLSLELGIAHHLEAALHPGLQPSPGQAGIDDAAGGDGNEQQVRGGLSQGLAAARGGGLGEGLFEAGGDGRLDVARQKRKVMQTMSRRPRPRIGGRKVGSPQRSL